MRRRCDLKGRYSSEDAARAEAERMAGVYAGHVFGVYECGPVVRRHWHVFSETKAAEAQDRRVAAGIERLKARFNT